MAAPVTTAAPSANGQNTGPGPPCQRAEAEWIGAAASDAVATPKLMDICCIVLAMELAMLVSNSVTSA